MISAEVQDRMKERFEEQKGFLEDLMSRTAKQWTKELSEYLETEHGGLCAADMVNLGFAAEQMKDLFSQAAMGMINDGKEELKKDHPIVKIDKSKRVEALMALHDASKPLGMGVLQNLGRKITREEAEAQLERSLYVDYCYGRVIKVDFSREDLDMRLYDRDVGHNSGWMTLMAAGLVKEL